MMSFLIAYLIFSGFIGFIAVLIFRYSEASLMIFLIVSLGWPLLFLGHVYRYAKRKIHD